MMIDSERTTCRHGTGVVKHLMLVKYWKSRSTSPQINARNIGLIANSYYRGLPSGAQATQRPLHQLLLILIWAEIPTLQ